MWQGVGCCPRLPGVWLGVLVGVWLGGGRCEGVGVWDGVGRCAGDGVGRWACGVGVRA